MLAFSNVTSHSSTAIYLLIFHEFTLRLFLAHVRPDTQIGKLSFFRTSYRSSSSAANVVERFF